MTAIALTHVPFEDAGLIAEALARRGLDLRTCPAWHMPDAAETAPLLIVLGGPISATQEQSYPFLRTEIALISRRGARDAWDLPWRATHGARNRWHGRARPRARDRLGAACADRGRTGLAPRRD